MHAIGQGERAGVGRPIPSVHAVHQAGDSARRVRGVQVHRHAADVPWAVARDSRQARVGGGPRRVDQDRPDNPGLHVPGKIGSLEVDRMTAFGEDEGASVRPHGPPSIRYVMFDTPLVASVALRYTVTAETNQPLLPGVPDSDAVVTGATVSTFTVREFVVSVSPALSVALYSTRCTPSPRTKGTE